MDSQYNICSAAGLFVVYAVLDQRKLICILQVVAVAVQSTSHICAKTKQEDFNSKMIHL